MKPKMRKNQLFFIFFPKTDTTYLFFSYLYGVKYV